MNSALERESFLSLEKLKMVHAIFPERRAELVANKIIISEAMGFAYGEVAVAFLCELRSVVRPKQLGRLTGGGALFHLPNGDVRFVDGAFVSRDKLPTSPQGYAKIVPDLIMLVVQDSNSCSSELAFSSKIKSIEDKIFSFLALGTILAIAIDMDKQEVTTYKAGRSKTVFRNGDKLIIPELFPEWSLEISELWPPDFSETINQLEAITEL